MRLQTKLSLVLLVGLGSVIALSQAIQHWRVGRETQRLAAQATTIVEERERQSSANLEHMMDFFITDYLGRGEMDVFGKLAELQATIPGLTEFSLYDIRGRVTHSSDKSALKRTLPAELKDQLFASHQPIRRLSD